MRVATADADPMEEMTVSHSAGGIYDVVGRTAERARWKSSGANTVVMNYPGNSAISRIRQNCGWLLGKDYILDNARSRSALKPLGQEEEGMLAPFSKHYLRMRGLDVLWVGLGWVHYRACEIKSGENSCDPTQKWMSCGSDEEVLHCIEKHNENTYLVKMKAGHNGFPLPSIGLSDKCEITEDDSKVGGEIVHAASMLSGLSSRFMNDQLSEFYLLTAVGNNRQVSFRLYSRDGRTFIGDAKGDKAHPRLFLDENDQDKETGGRNTCGGEPTAACPQFYRPQVQPTDEARIGWDEIKKHLGPQ